MITQILARDSKLVGRENDEDADGGDFATRTFFESLFLLADNNNKGELVVEDFETLFQARNERRCRLPCLPTKRTRKCRKSVSFIVTVMLSDECLRLLRMNRSD